jgi:anti-sigma regulatory factor (Ser/Thr protein kinase)
MAFGQGRAAMMPSGEMTASFANDTAEIAKLAGEIETFLTAAKVPEKIRFQINLSIDELVTNTILYGYDDQVEHLIRVTLRSTSDEVLVTIEDDGHAFNPFSPTAAPVDVSLSIEDRPIGGLGLHFVKSMMNQVSYARVGGKNLVTLRRSTRDTSGEPGDRTHDDAAEPDEADRRE